MNEIKEFWLNLCRLILNRPKTVRLATLVITESGKINLPNKALIIWVKNTGDNVATFCNYTIEPTTNNGAILLGGIAYDLTEQDLNDYEIIFVAGDGSNKVEILYKVEVLRGKRPVEPGNVDNEL